MFLPRWQLPQALACRGSDVISGWWKDTGRPEDILEANQFVLTDLRPYNWGRFECDVKATGVVAIGDGTVIKSKCTLKGLLIIGMNSEIGLGTYVGPYTSIGDNVSIKDEIDDSIVLNDTAIKCGKRIIDSLVGRASRIVSTERDLPKDYKLIIRENTLVSL
jgi:glucose-1-phosphate thymidylyltransferase